MNSLRTRAVAVGVVWALMATLLGLWLLSSYLNGQSRERFVTLLETRHTQVLVAVANNAAAPELIPQAIGDPVFQRPFSGHYWQVESLDGELQVAPSLVDGLLPEAGEPFSGVDRRTITTPDGEELLCFGQWLTTEDGQQWYVQSASSIAILKEEIADQQRTLYGAFALIAVIVVVSALGQVTAMLRPLNDLRKDITARWENEEGLEIASYPTEVAPLVRDINDLLDRNLDVVKGSRKQAADLAHAIKTPAAIMRNELEVLAAGGKDVSDALGALDRLDAQLQRSLARMRADGSEGAVRVTTDLDTALGRMKRAFSALAANEGKAFSAEFAEGLRIRMDQSDFEEVLGNILDNALKWSTSRFTLAASPTNDPAVLITISDDGPGVPADEIGEIVKSGRRLDQSKPGTGLGLAIASDLVGVYGGVMQLDRSHALGGLVVHLKLPVPGGPKLSA